MPCLVRPLSDRYADNIVDEAMQGITDITSRRISVEALRSVGSATQSLCRLSVHTTQTRRVHADGKVVSRPAWEREYKAWHDIGRGPVC